jgi:hypothetical protein
MSFNLTERARRESQKLKIEPQLVLEIEGVTTLYGAVTISRLIRIGDPGLLIGDTWKIGGLTPVEDQADVLSLDGTTTKIDQLLYPDKGSVSSVSSVQLTLIDRDEIITQLITPGFVIEDIMGAKAKLWMGFKNTAFKEDYIPVFSGIIDDVDSGAGTIKINVAHPEQKKRQILFPPVSVELSGSINNFQTSINLVDASGLNTYHLGPDGNQDGAITFYIKVEDEFISYAGISGNTLTGCVRGELASLAVAHTVVGDPIQGKSLVQIADTAINCALKLMLSGVNGFWAESVPATRFNHPDLFTTVPNSIFFYGIDLNRDYGVVSGDYVTVTGAANGANNFSAKIIQDIVVTEDGSYAVLAGVSFVDELDSAALASFRSQYDTLGYGLGLTPDQVDVSEHVFWNNFQLAIYSYRFVLQDEISGKDFLDKEVYLPIGAYSLPRQGRCSMGYHIGPIVRGTVKTISRANVKDPDKIRLRRTLGRNFYNTITYQFDKKESNEKFASGTITQDADSLEKIAIGNRAFSVKSAGMRRDLAGTAVAERVSARYLGRYKFAAEFIERISILFRDGCAIEAGDVVLLDPTGLQMSNTVDGNRAKPPKVFEVTNKSLDLKTGDVTLSLTDSNFDATERYGSVSPSSLIVSGTTTVLTIQDSFGAIFPGNESRKWEEYLGLPIIVHSLDWSFEEQVTLLAIDPSDKYKLILDPSTPLSTAPSAGYIIDVGNYPNTANPEDNARYKAVHAFQGASVAVTGGADSTHFTVGDVGKFSVGSVVRLHNYAYTDDSGEVTITDITGTIITVSASLGFTPTTSHVAENMNFADGGTTYRIF